MPAPTISQPALILVAAGTALMAVNVARYRRIDRMARAHVPKGDGRVAAFLTLHQWLMILFLAGYAALLAAMYMDVPVLCEAIIGIIVFLGAAMIFNGTRLQLEFLARLKVGYRDLVTASSTMEGDKERLDQLNDQLDRETTERRRFQEADRIKSAFLTDASRQMREPLESLVAHAERIRELVHGEAHADEAGDDSPEALLDEIKWRLEAVIRDGRRVDRMCRDMYTLASDVDRHILDSGQVTPLAGLLREAARSAAVALARRPGIDFTTDIQDTLPAVRMDPAVLQDIVSGLLAHVIEHVAGGTVHFSGTQRADGRIRISVRNLGGEPATVDQLLDARAGDPENEALSNCRKIASHYGGRIWTETNQDTGHVLYLEFPASVRSGPS